MMTTGFEIRKYIIGIVNRAISVNEMTEFVHFTRSIAEVYFLRFRSTIIRLCSEHGISVSDLSIDCIGEIFSRDENDEFFIIDSFVRSLNQPITVIPETDLFLAYKSFVVRMANIQLARTYAQIDPVGARIHRNIKKAIKKSSVLSLRDNYNGYIIHSNNGVIHGQLESFQFDLLEKKLIGDPAAYRSVPALIEMLAEFLREQDSDNNSVRLIDFVQVVRKYYSGRDPNEIINDGTDISGEITSVDLKILQREIIREIQGRIISTYVLPGKLNKSEAQTLYLIMSDIIAGFCQNEKEKNSYYDSTRKFISISKEEYNKEWRVKIEYLARLARGRLLLYFSDQL